MTILADQVIQSSRRTLDTQWFYEGDLLLGSECGPLEAGTIGPFPDVTSAQNTIEMLVREGTTLEALHAHTNVDLHKPAADLIHRSAPVVGAILTRRTTDGKCDDWTLQIGASVA